MFRLDLIDRLKLDPEAARRLSRAAKRASAEEDDDEIDDVMERANELLNGRGVESLRPEEDGEAIALYVDLGSDEKDTVVFDLAAGVFHVTSPDEFLKEWNDSDEEDEDEEDDEEDEDEGDEEEDDEDAA